MRAPLLVRSTLAAIALAALASVTPCCATLASPAGGSDLDLPSAGAGPFRPLQAGEVAGVAPYVLDAEGARYREPAALALDDDPTSGRVALYAVARDRGADVIVRTRADDARSFFGTALDVGHAPAIVLRGGAPWEGAGVRSPCALRVGARVYLYYAADGGIGLAVSADGLTFQKQAAPVLAADRSSPWERGAPGGASVAPFPDGTWHMMYAAGGAIGEATSRDGLTWTRAPGPVLAPRAPTDPRAAAASGDAPAFDDAAVGDPWLFPRITAAGRLHVRVLYTGTDARGETAIGFAARYGDAGGLTRHDAPVYAPGAHAAAPSLFAWGDRTLLYVQQDHAAGRAGDPAYPAIAAGLAPATATLPEPSGAADGP